jgi:ATP-dependent Zn protease
MLLSLIYGIGAYDVSLGGLLTSVRLAESLSPATMERGDRIYYKRMNELYSQTKRILLDNKDFALSVARALMDRKTLAADEILAMRIPTVHTQTDSGNRAG